MTWRKGIPLSPAMAVAILALAVAVGGTAVAGPGKLNKKEKRQVRNIASERVTSLAPGLSVASAETAGVANSAANAANAVNAANAANAANAVNSTNAANASALQGSSLAEVSPAARGYQSDCVLVAGANDCATVNLTLDRTADVLVFAIAQWYSPDAGSVAGHCVIRRDTGPNPVTTFDTPFGSTANDTDPDQSRTLAITALLSTQVTGPQLFILRCFEDQQNIVLDEINLTAVATT